MHEIQIYILTSLLKNNSSTFTSMKPPDIENDQYNYHLKYLISQEFIVKNNRNYQLTMKGKKFISNLDVFGKMQQFFKVSVALFVVRNNPDNPSEKQMLVQKRLRHPFYGDIHGFAGKIRLGETVVECTKRKLAEECGLIGDFKFVGVHRKMKIFNNKLVEDALYHQCYCENATGTLDYKNDFGEHYWLKIQEARKAL
ncbi:MAG TPA: NUDIX domain-containing protein [Candidatus Dojkabacteria bacterium]|nr:NUDIX domain-containing protein [Candidatus Dojkabacteria bacterium]